MKFTGRESLGYDDVVLIAQPAKIKSRSEIEAEGWRIVVSAMTSIVGPTFIRACAQLDTPYQPTIHVPRDIHWRENMEEVMKQGYPREKIFVGLGLNTSDIELYANLNGFKQVLLDVANGYLPSVLEKVKDLSDRGFLVCAGSVHSFEGARALEEAGCKIVRSGIGPGSACITKDVTGFTRGIITEIEQLNNGVNEATILADGGVRSSADCVKAFLAGADYVMSGRLFVKAVECRMHQYKECIQLGYPEDLYFGMASSWGKMAMGNKVKHLEGTEQYIIAPYSPLEWIMEELWQGIKSGISYSGYASVWEAIGNGVFEIIHK